MYQSIRNEYFMWLYKFVNGDSMFDISYGELLTFLHNIEFKYNDYLFYRDRDREITGKMLRYRFGDEVGYSESDISTYLDIYPCSVLEMMVGLAIDIEEKIMQNDAYGSRTQDWFWMMITNLNLIEQTDVNFDEQYSLRCISLFLNRQYSPNGEPNLFRITDGRDLRVIDIWSQACWYMNKILGLE